MPCLEPVSWAPRPGCVLPPIVVEWTKSPLPPMLTLFFYRHKALFLSSTTNFFTKFCMIVEAIERYKTTKFRNFLTTGLFIMNFLP